MSETSETTVDPNTLATPASFEELQTKMKVKGKVKRLELYGAFIDIGIGTNALIHISQLGTEHVNRVNDILNEGDEVDVWVSKVDPAKKQVMVTMIEPYAVEWSDLKEGQIYNGRVTRLENFGAFINIGAEREGLVHISELSHGYIKHPSEIVRVDDELEVKVLGYNKRKRRIDLSSKALLDKPEPDVNIVVDRSGRVKAADVEEEEEDLFEMPTAMEIAMRRAMGERIPRRQKGKKRDKRNRRRHQEDILSRTLHMQE